MNGLHEVELLGGELPGEPLAEHLAVADDRGERRAELVADGREEIALEPIELLQAIERLLEPRRLLFELAIALAHAHEVHLARHEGLVAAEQDEVE